MTRNQIDKTAHFSLQVVILSCRFSVMISPFHKDNYRQQCVCILLVNKLLQILKDTIQLTLEFILHPQAAAHRFNIQLHI